MTLNATQIHKPTLIAIILALIICLGSPISATSEDSTFADLNKRFSQAVEEFMVEYQEADETEQEAMLKDTSREPRGRFTPLFLGESRRLQGTELALPGWTWLAEHGTIADREVGDLAVERILEDHLSSPDLGPAAKAIRRSAGVRGQQRALADLSLIVEASFFDSVLAAALLQRGLLLRRSDQPVEAAVARADLERAIQLATDDAITTAASKGLADLGVLAIGTKAPPLTGITVGGEPIDGSQLEGRVVLVEFWGMWCGPCVAKLPKLGRLEARFRDRPFTILGINSDSDSQLVREFLEAKGTLWPSIADGSTEGPVATAWHVNAWPASYLIDGEGRIQARDPSLKEVLSFLEDLAPSSAGPGDAQSLDGESAQGQPGQGEHLMPYEIWWALVILVWILGSIGFAVLRAYLVGRQRLRLRELVHAERMAALERGVAPIELPDLATEIAALEPSSGRTFRRPVRAGGILLVTAGLGVCSAFFLSNESNLTDTWSLGLIGVLLGIGLLLTDQLSSTRGPLE